MDYLHRNKHTFLQSYGDKARREAELYGNTPKDDHVHRYGETSSLLLPCACPILQSSELNAGPAWDAAGSSVTLLDQPICQPVTSNQLLTTRN